MWDSVAEKTTLNSAGAEIGIRGQTGLLKRISGKRRRKSMAVLSVPGVVSCKVYLLKPCSGSTRR